MIIPNDIPVSKITNFNDFYSRSSKYKTNYFITYFSIAKSEKTVGDIKFAVAASKKGVHKRAVKRNRVRRRIKHAFKDYLRTLIMPPGIELQLLFMASRLALEVKWEQLLEAINIAMQKVLLKCAALLGE